MPYNDHQGSSQKLAALAKTLSTSKSDVLRSALALYAFVQKVLHPATDTQLAIVNANDEVRKLIVVPGLRTKDAILIRMPVAYVAEPVETSRSKGVGAD